jgi:GWxTD domain-containing protein
MCIDTRAIIRHRSAGLMGCVRVAASVALVVLMTSCLRSAAPSGVPLPSGNGPRATSAAAAEPVEFYREAGFIAAAEDVPFVGAVRFLAGRSSDTAYALIALSFANHALTFTREDERYHASYEVALEVRRDTSVLHRSSAHEDVRVGSFKETTRDEESVIFQRIVALPRGEVTIDITVTDAANGRRGHAATAIVVPTFDNESLGWPIVAYDAAPRSTRAAQPNVVMNPRATVVFGRDSVLSVYLEAYGGIPPFIVRVTAQTLDGHTVTADTVPMLDRGGVLTGDAKLRVARLGLGLLRIIATRQDGSDAVAVPAVVSFGEGLVVATFDEMLEYLRYFVPPDRLQALRDATPAQRPAAWMTFVRETDPNPLTAEQEGLRDYFERIRTANKRFREPDTPGWTTDRGKVFDVLGEPEEISEPVATPSQRGRTQVWEYRRQRARFVFVEEGNGDRWRLTSASQAEFDAMLRRPKP